MPSGKRFIYQVFFCLALALLLPGCLEKEEKGNAVSKSVPDIIDFNFHIKPIFSDRCFACHGPDDNARQGDFRLDTETGAFRVLGEAADRHAIVPGFPDSSVIIHRLTNKDPDKKMPPPASNLAVSDYEIELIRKWISQGATWKKHWSFLPPNKSGLPNISQSDWANNSIDHFILARLEQKGISPSPKADKAILLRRASFDLAGIPPTLAELDAFLQDSSSTAFETVIDRLLASTHFGERMATIWLDAARYADTHGYQNDVPRSMWPWRNWVIHAFNSNLPFDQFLRWQLAGDLLPDATNEQIIATGFNRNHKITFEGGSIDEEFRVEYVADRTHTTATVFMGLTMECARCHDHKYDPISQQDYYRLFSFFNNLEEPGVGNYSVRSPAPRLELDWDEAIANLAFISDKGNLNKLEMMVMKDVPDLRRTFVLNRGQYDQPTIEVTANTPAALPAMGADLPRNRLGLADWLLAENHPLVSRVQVNRIWHMLFGRGIVATLDDFGSQGALPTHPQLLDWLAVEFRENGWDMKAMLKLIMMSATYQQTSNVSEAVSAADPENELLARGPRYRLPAEMIRDNALYISNLLVDKIGGPSVKPYQPRGLWAEKTAGNGFTTYEPDTGDGLYRKSLYTFWKRTVPPPSMLIFDGATRDVSTADRQATSTPLQALVLMNDPQMIEASRFLAYRMISEGGNELETRLQFGFRLATSRQADAAEIEILKNLYYEKRMLFDGNAKKVKELLEIGARPHLENFGKSETAAYTIVANVLLNLHNSFTKL